MKAFLRAYWPYVVVPIAIVAAIVVVLAWLGEEPAGPFHYNH